MTSLMVLKLYGKNGIGEKSFSSMTSLMVLKQFNQFNKCLIMF